MKNSGCFKGDKKFLKYKKDYYKDNNILIIKCARGESKKVKIKCEICKEILIKKETDIANALRDSYKFKKEYKYKCFDCANKLKSGSASCKWKGGKHIVTQGYVILSVFKDENGRTKRVYEHRNIMEKHLGRKLKRTEIVHHINGLKTDNRIENLELISAHTHTAITRMESEWERKIKDLEDENKRLKEQLFELVD